MSNKYGSLSELSAHLRKETITIPLNEPPEIQKLRSTGYKFGAKSDAVTAMAALDDILRKAANRWYRFLVALNKRKITHQVVLSIYRCLEVPHAHSLGAMGLNKIADLAVNLSTLLQANATRRGDTEKVIEEAIEAVAIFLAYLNQFVSWGHHWFPVPKVTALADTRRGSNSYSPNLSRRIRVQDCPRVTLTWSLHDIDVTDAITIDKNPALVRDIKIIAILAVKENPALVRDFADALPFTVLVDQVVDSQASMRAYLPVVLMSVANVVESPRDAPPGQIRLSYGCELTIQTGAGENDSCAPVLAEILETSWGDLYYVTRKVRRNMETKKRVITLTVELAN